MKYLKSRFELGPQGGDVKYAADAVGFKVLDNAVVTIAGIELANRTRKRQFVLGRLCATRQAVPAIFKAVLNA